MLSHAVVLSFYFQRRPLRALFLVMGLLATTAGSTLAGTLSAAFAPDLTPSNAAEIAGWRSVAPATLGGGGGVPTSTVRARWNNDWLVFEFVCRDLSIVSPGEEDGLDHFRLGDTVEIFVGRAGKKNYTEVHATPAGRKTLYFFRDYRVPGPAPAGAGSVAVQAGRVRGGWRAVVCLPWSVLGGAPERGEWEVLAGRYDHAIDGGPAQLSSFPVQRRDHDFHARSRYARLVLQL